MTTTEFPETEYHISVSMVTSNTAPYRFVRVEITDLVSGTPVVELRLEPEVWAAISLSQATMVTGPVMPHLERVGKTKVTKTLLEADFDDAVHWNAEGLSQEDREYRLTSAIVQARELGWQEVRPARRGAAPVGLYCSRWEGPSRYDRP